MKKQISRRSFLKGTAAGALGLGTAATFGSAAIAEDTKAEEINWTAAADVVIVGGGGAGFTAAIEAAKAGSSVLILEKGDVCGGDTRLSGGMIMVGGCDLQADHGYPDDTPEKFANTELRYSGIFTDHEMVKEMCMASPDEYQFLKSIGRVFDTVDPMMPVWGYDNDEEWAPRTIWSNLGNRTGIFAALEAEASKYDTIRVKTATEVAHLITGEDGSVIGVKDVNGKCYRANKGVLLATASFGRNKEMSKRYNLMNYWALCSEEAFNTPTPNGQSANNYGDGIRMAQEIGADLALTTANCISDVCSLSFDSLYGALLVNERGQRFVQEDAHWGYVNQMAFNEAVRINAADPSKVRFWTLADNATATKNIYANMMLNGMTVLANQSYLDLIVKADTIDELIEKTGLPADNVKATISRWNDMVAAGQDTDFSRKSYYVRDDFEAFGEGPYYAFPYIPYSMGSFGGLRANKETQVLNLDGNAIPRLYAAGSIISGMFTAPFYNACGWSILGVIHWGRKAGTNVAAMEPWATGDIVEETADDTSAVQAAIDAANGTYTPGTYTATAKGINGDFTVTMTFNEKAMTGLVIGENQETEGLGSVAAEKLPDRILAAQSADVDTISGATITSNAIIAAVKDCVAQASK